MIQKGQREAPHFFSRSLQGRWPARRYQGPAGGRSNIISHGSAEQSSADDCVQHTRRRYPCPPFLCQVQYNIYYGRAERNCRRKTCERRARRSLLVQRLRGCLLPSSLFLHTKLTPPRSLSFLDSSHGCIWRLSGHTIAQQELVDVESNGTRTTDVVLVGFFGIDTYLLPGHDG